VFPSILLLFRFGCLFFVTKLTCCIGSVQIDYLKQYGALLERHFHRTVLDHLPKTLWRVLDEPEMVDRPNLDQFVFCRTTEKVEIDNYDPLGDEEQDDMNIQEHAAGACLIARYSAIRNLVKVGKIDLLM
jgi:GINS complex subunit 4